MLDAEAGEDAADDHRVGAIDRAAGRGSVEGPAGPVGVERPGQAVGGEDGPRGPSARHGWSLRPERRVEQPRGRLVDDREARLALARTEGEPLLVAAVEVQELTEAGAGIAGVGELTDHTVQVLNRMSGERSESEVFAQSLAFDCLPQIGPIEPSGDTSEEAALAHALHRLVSISGLALELTRVRIPTLGGSLAAVHVELAEPRTLAQARELLAAQTRVHLLPEGELPTPRAALGHDDVAIGRLRAAGSRVAFVLALNDLRLGAALGVVSAAEALLG